MNISDLDYSNSILDTAASRVEGGNSAVAISAFYGFAWGRATNTSTVLYNQANSLPYNFSAYSSINVQAVASGRNAVTSASASSVASVSKYGKFSYRI